MVMARVNGTTPDNDPSNFLPNPCPGRPAAGGAKMAGRMKVVRAPEWGLQRVH
jgi:hypothetical protein